MTTMNDPLRKFFDELGYRFDLHPTLAPAGDIWPELDTHDLHVMWLRDRQHRREATPHGNFTIHASKNDFGPNGGPSIHVVCECGRGYAWERKIPDVELTAWLSNHGPDISLSDEERRVAAAGGREPIAPKGRP